MLWNVIRRGPRNSSGKKGKNPDESGKTANSSGNNVKIVDEPGEALSPVSF